ncbi:MAG: adenylate/guanylate cyclase domain-containing protein [Geminicoccaceae bacterium]
MRRVVLIADIVESVRLIEADEEGIIARWLALVRLIEHDLMPASNGHLVKSLGDGLLLEFEDARTAVLAAFAIQQASARDNKGQPADRLMLLRIGIEECDVIINGRDVFGHGVNLAARLTSLAGPGEVVVSAAVREQITPDLDADVEDLGECFLKHLTDPVRAYRTRPPGASRPPRLAPAPVNLFPTLAIIPFVGGGTAKEHDVLGEILAEELIHDFSRCPDLNVISRLSTTAFRRRIDSLNEVRDHLNANYVLSGTYSVDGGRIRVDAELAEAKLSSVIWSERIEDTIEGIVSGDSEIVGRLKTNVRTAVLASAVKRTRLQSLPTLESYTLLMSAIAMMHRMSRSDFDRAYEMLEVLIERMPRQSVPPAWLAKWHVLKVQQGWSDDSERESKQAQNWAHRALDADPESSHALAIDGLVHTNLLKRLDIAERRYEQAINANPNDSLAWSLKGTLHAFKGEGEAAVAGTQNALALSPLDPLRYLYETLAATALNTANKYEEALAAARYSLRANRSHTSTLRTMVIAQWQLGQKEHARETLEQLLLLEPSLTVSKFLERSPAAGYETGDQWADIFKKAGLPE